MNINSCNLCTYIKWNIYSNAKYVSEPFDIKGFILLWVETFCIVNSVFLPQHFPPHVHVQVCAGTPILANGHLAKADHFLWCTQIQFSLPASQSANAECCPAVCHPPWALLARLYNIQQNTWILNTVRKHIFYTIPLLLESILQMSKVL